MSYVFTLWHLRQYDTAKSIISHSTRILQQYCNLHWRMTFAADEWMGITFLPQCALDKRRKLDYLYTTRFARTIRDDMPTLMMAVHAESISILFRFPTLYVWFFLLLFIDCKQLKLNFNPPTANQSINQWSECNTQYREITYRFIVCSVLDDRVDLLIEYEYISIMYKITKYNGAWWRAPISPYFRVSTKYCCFVRLTFLCDRESR